MENINKYASGVVESLGACNAEIMNLSVLIKHVAPILIIVITVVVTKKI